MTHNIPVIDIAPLRQGNDAEREAVASAIGRACRETGFFYITGHGVSPDTIDSEALRGLAHVLHPARRRQGSRGHEPRGPEPGLCGAGGRTA